MSKKPTTKKATKPKQVTIQLRPDAKELQIYDTVKKITGKKVYSAAILDVCTDYPILLEKLKRLEAQVHKQENEITRYSYVMRDLKLSLKNVMNFDIKI